MGQNIPMFLGKTSGCFGERHPDVLHIKVLYREGLSPKT